ncbi:MAG: hypothetical protein ACYCX8_06420 [Acidimicrobiales bacterium]
MTVTPAGDRAATLVAPGYLPPPNGGAPEAELRVGSFQRPARSGDAAGRAPTDRQEIADLAASGLEQ